MKILSRHTVVEFVNCANDISDKEIIEKSLDKNLPDQSISTREFENWTAFNVFSGQSQVLVKSYPGEKHLSIDIFSASVPSQLIEALKEEFKPENVNIVEITRGNPLDVKEKDWISEYSQSGFEVKYHAKKWLLSKKTKYQQMDIIDNDIFGRMLFLGKELQITESDADIYNKHMISPLAKNGKLGKVAILGGGDGGVLCELLKHNPEKAFMVDMDSEVIEAAKRFLPMICNNAFDDKRVSIIIDDANKFLETNNEFDAIIYDLTTRPETIIKADRKQFLSEIFLKIRKSLKTGGLLSMQCCSVFDDKTKMLMKGILSENFSNVKFTDCFIPSFCEKWVFASAEAK